MLARRNTAAARIGRFGSNARSISVSGSAILSAIGLAFGYETLDLKVDDKEVAGVVRDIEPLVAKKVAANGENVIVKLDGGPVIRILAYKSRGIKIGDKIEVMEHHHATGRMTHTLK